MASYPVSHRHLLWCPSFTPNRFVSCQQTSSGEAGSVVSGTAVSTAGRVEWQVIAHEIGHNFGAIVSATSRFPILFLTLFFPA